ncbi:MAG: hypothetical protein IH626_14095 [Rhodospirillales bacterium]|nr:hypothetical protein [Rhodospirillales bacterium]
MESIHIKTVDPISQDLLRSAARRGIDLNWERYEKQQPQDGFLRTGLSCPYGCLQGPCRIDPFGRGASKGLCGLERDGMAAALLLRLCVNGALEAVNMSGKAGGSAVPAWPSALAKPAAATLKKLGGGDLSSAEIFAGVAALARPAEGAPALVRRALRLGLLTLGLAGVRPSRAAKKPVPFSVGYGVLAGKAATIGVCGQVAPDLVDGLLTAAKASKTAVRVVSLGSWIGGKALLPMACTSAEAELVTASGAIDAVVWGPVAGAAVPALCAQLGIPAFVAAEADAKAVVTAAVKAKAKGEKCLQDDPAVVGAGEVISAETLAAELKADKKAHLAVIGGVDTLQSPLGWLPTELPPALAAAKCKVASWGDAALWMAKRGFAGGNPGVQARVLDGARGALDAIDAAVSAGGLSRLRGIAFTGLGGSRDLASALGAAALGARVCVAVPLPLWGSSGTRDALAAAVKSCGGSFTHFDHPATADEVRAWFIKR